MDINLSTLFKKKDDSALGIDIGSSSIKVVQLKKKGNRAVLETYGELSLGPYAGVSVGQATKLSTDRLIEAMKGLLTEKEVNVTTRNCGIAIPFHASLLTVMEMPAASEQELNAMVPIEARKYIPVPISEVALNWSVIPKLEARSETQEVADTLAKEKKEEPKTIDILLAAIHNNIIAEYQSVVTSAGLNATFFEIELFSAVRSVLDDDNVRSALILDIGAASTKVYVMERGIIRGSHIINRGSQDITTAIANANSVSFGDAEVLKRTVGLTGGGDNAKIRDSVALTLSFIFSEANRVLFDYQKQHNRNLDKVLLIGGGSALRGLVPLASENFRIPVEAGNPFLKVETPAFLEQVLSETGPEFAVSVGVALRKLKEM